MIQHACQSVQGSLPEIENRHALREIPHSPARSIFHPIAATDPARVTGFRPAMQRGVEKNGLARYTALPYVSYPLTGAR